MECTPSSDLASSWLLPLLGAVGRRHPGLHQDAAEVAGLLRGCQDGGGHTAGECKLFIHPRFTIGERSP